MGDDLLIAFVQFSGVSSIDRSSRYSKTLAKFTLIKGLKQFSNVVSSGVFNHIVTTGLSVADRACRLAQRVVPCWAETQCKSEFWKCKRDSQISLSFPLSRNSALHCVFCSTWSNLVVVVLQAQNELLSFTSKDRFWTYRRIFPSLKCVFNQCERYKTYKQ